MQTFLPYDNFALSASVLDNKRLGKQRVEAKQILDTLNGSSGGWKNHPAVLMWKGHERALKFYFNCMVYEWRSRGFISNMECYRIQENRPFKWPLWLQDNRLIISHRCNLVRKDPDFYGRLWPKADPKAPYFWPTGLKNKQKNREMLDYWN